MTLVRSDGTPYTRQELEAERAKDERLRAYDGTSDKLRRVLVAMRQLRERDKLPASPNEVAYESGYRPGMARMGNNGARNGLRTMGVAVHVTSTLRALERRGLVEWTRRRDGLSGTACDLTRLGLRVATTAAVEGFDADAAAAEGKRARR